MTDHQMATRGSVSHPRRIIGAMATCIDCNLEMTTADGCTLSEVKIDGEVFARRRCERQRCRDCAVKPGRFHHLGCCAERCPRCRGQLISCGCWTDGVEDELEEDE
jgi:hypothetical protein